MKFNSLKTKIIVYFITLFIFLLLFFSIGFYYYFNQNQKNKLKSELSKMAFNIEEKLENSQKIDSPYVKIVKKTNNVNEFLIEDLGESLKVTYMLPFKDKVIIISKIVDDESEDVVDSMLIIEPILLFILIFMSIKIVNKLLKPIDEITQGFKNISVNNFDNTISNNYTEKEIKELINSFNEMILRLQEGVKNLDRFNSDVSHELKTPLTIIKGEINVTLKKLRNPQEYIFSMKTILEEVENMNKIINNLLLLTKYTKENIKNSFSNCNLDLILLEVLEKYEKSDKKIKLNIENIEYFGNCQLIYHIFINLIDNAIKYSHSKVEIKLYKKDKIYFEVSDDGDGIDKKYINKITNRFFRIDSSRNKNIQGFGLGLSIVKKAIELHKGELNIASNSNATKIVVCL